MARIAFFDTKPYDQEFFEKINLSFGNEIKFLKSRLGPDSAVMAQGYDTVCAFVNDDLSAPVIEKLHEQGVKLIAMRCAGYNNVDIKAAFGKLHVVRVPAYSPYAVAEHALALMLTLNRKTNKAYNRTREGDFSLPGLIGFDMHGKTAGIIGTGRIGKVLANILKGIGMTVLLYDVHPDLKFAYGMGAEYVPLERIVAESDVISLHCPLTADTYHLINDEAISGMKDGVMLINTSRGQLIDTVALINGLKTRKIGYAGLDVYEEEGEYFFEDLSDKIIEDDVLARLLSFNNVVVTSHQAFFTREAMENIAGTTFENVKAFETGGKLVNEICYKCGEDPVDCKKTRNGRCF